MPQRTNDQWDPNQPAGSPMPQDQDEREMADDEEDFDEDDELDDEDEADEGEDVEEE